MSADNYYMVRRHSDGGFALQMGFMSDEDPLPPVHSEYEAFPTVEAAIKAFSDGQVTKDGEIYPRYYCEYGLKYATGIFDDPTDVFETKVEGNPGDTFLFSECFTKGAVIKGACFEHIKVTISAGLVTIEPV